MGLHRSQSVWKESQVSSISNLLHKKEDKTSTQVGEKEVLYTFHCLNIFSENKLPLVIQVT